MVQILLKDINFMFQNTCILKNINLEIEDRDFIEITGPNGGGKTTLLKIIVGILRPTSGKIEHLEPIKFGYVPQFSQFERTFPINALDTVLMGTLSKPVSFFYKYKTEDIEQAESIMDLLKLSNMKYQPIAHLSGGQLQKVLFARALMTEPNVMLLDEPTANLDQESQGIINELLGKLHKKITLLKVSHDPSTSEYANKIAYIDSKLKMTIK